MSTGADNDPIARFTRGDDARARLLRRNLTTIGENNDDPHVRALVRDVLDGRRTVRELVRDSAFEQLMNQSMERFSQYWEELTPDERAALVREGQREEEQRRLEAGLPPLDEPPARVGDSPLLRTDL